MSDSSNPLLDFSGLPRFGDIQPAHVVPAVEKLLAEARAVIARLEADTAQPTWQSFVRPLEATNERLSRAWGVVGHLHAVLDSPALREAYNAAQPAVVQFYTELGQNLALFERYKTLQASSEYGRLSPAQRKILDNEIRDFRLSGAELPPAQKQRLAEIQEEQARLATRFSENVLDATNAFQLDVSNESELDGLTGYDGTNNFYLYRLENQVKHVMIAWDDDNAFWGPTFPVKPPEDNVLLAALMRIPSYNALWYSELARANQLAEQDNWLDTEIIRQVQMIDEAMKADPYKPYSSNSYEGKAGEMLSFARDRIAYVKCALASGDRACGG